MRRAFGVCVAIASVVACSALGQGPGESPAQDVACVPTAAQADDPQLIVGGDLGARPGRLASGSAVKVLWLRRNTSAGESLRIQGRRLGGPQRVNLTLRAASSTVQWPGGGLAHGYPSNVELPSSGCWIFSVVDGKPADSLTFRVLD